MTSALKSSEKWTFTKVAGGTLGPTCDGKCVGLVCDTFGIVALLLTLQATSAEPLAVCFILRVGVRR